MGHSLALVMPVYNEQACIASVVRAWRAALAALGMDFVMLILNDGSTDGTADALKEFADDERVRVVHRPNAGHGPTILQGYRQAVQEAQWVFQCDSDNEMSPDAFAQLWNRRDAYDAVFAYRQGRGQGATRRVLTTGACLAVRLLFGAGVRDANVPYRLIRAAWLGPVVERIAPQTFAPNVLIAGALISARARLANVPVPYQARRTGRSIPRWRVCRGALQSLWHTVRQRKRLAAALSDRNDPPSGPAGLNEAPTERESRGVEEMP
jgi:glycosyltransferase involved in cell wall biosynthesis